MLSSYAWTGEEAVIINADPPDKTDAIKALTASYPLHHGFEVRRRTNKIVRCGLNPTAYILREFWILSPIWQSNFTQLAWAYSRQDYGPESQEDPLCNRACNYLMSEELSESKTKIKVRPAGACIRWITWWDKNWIEQQQTAKFHVLHRDMRNTWAAHASGLCVYYNYKEHLLWRWNESPAPNWLIHVTLLLCPFLQ